jgi:hypothetical protein
MSLTAVTGLDLDVVERVCREEMVHSVYPGPCPLPADVRRILPRLGFAIVSEQKAAQPLFPQWLQERSSRLPTLVSLYKPGRDQAHMIAVQSNLYVDNKNEGLIRPIQDAEYDDWRVIWSASVCPSNPSPAA